MLRSCLNQFLQTTDLCNAACCIACADAETRVWQLHFKKVLLTSRARNNLRVRRLRRLNSVWVSLAIPFPQKQPVMANQAPCEKENISGRSRRCVTKPSKQRFLSASLRDNQLEMHAIGQYPSSHWTCRFFLQRKGLQHSPGPLPKVACAASENPNPILQN